MCFDWGAWLSYHHRNTDGALVPSGGCTIRRVYHQQGVPSRLRHHHNKETPYHAASGCIRSPLARPFSSASPFLRENAAIVSNRRDTITGHVQAHGRPAATQDRNSCRKYEFHHLFSTRTARRGDTVSSAFRVRSDVNKDSDSLTVSTCLKLNIFVRV